MIQEQYGRKEHSRAFLAYACQDEDQPTSTVVLEEFVTEFQDVITKRVANMGARIKFTIGLTSATLFSQAS
jgi:hypothetical protein